MVPCCARKCQTRDHFLCFLPHSHASSQGLRRLSSRQAGLDGLPGRPRALRPRRWTCATGAARSPTAPSAPHSTTRASSRACSAGSTSAPAWWTLSTSAAAPTMAAWRRLVRHVTATNLNHNAAVLAQAGLARAAPLRCPCLCRFRAVPVRAQNRVAGTGKHKVWLL